MGLLFDLLLKDENIIVENCDLGWSDSEVLLKKYFKLTEYIL